MSTPNLSFNTDAPIVVLDSGLGGLTVVRAIRDLLPREDIVYFGDTARLPYGSKSAGTVSNFVRQIIQYLLPLDPKHFVFACNTATALALATLRAEWPHLSMSGVIEPGARAAVEAAGERDRPVIGVIGTDATIRSRAYEKAILHRRQYAKVFSQATPLLAPIVEEGRDANDPLVKLALEQYLAPLARQSLDVLVLGCTHYPIYRETIAGMLPDTAVIDSADKCAEDVLRRLKISGRARRSESSGVLRCYVTDNSPRFSMLASRFLGFEFGGAMWVSPDELPSAMAEAGFQPVRSAG